MKKKYRHCDNGYRIITLILLLMLFSCPLWSMIGHARAEETLSFSGGIGNVQVKAKNDLFRSDSARNGTYLGLKLDLKKEENPLRVSFRGTLMTTGDDSETWFSPPGVPLHRDTMDLDAMSLDLLAFVALDSLTFRTNIVQVTPYVGGGLLFRRFKLERDGLQGDMIPYWIGVEDYLEYYLDDQRILAMGVLPHLGFLGTIPKADIGFTVSLGWGFLGAKSTVNYQVSFPGNEEMRYLMQADTSGSSLVVDANLFKRWESFNLGFRFMWERIWIDDKSLFFYSSGATDVYLPFPEFEITQMAGLISIDYLF